MAKGNKKAKTGSDTGLVIYRGPIIPRQVSQSQSIKVPIKCRYPVTAASAGYIETYLQSNNFTNSGEWATYASLWREYRVLGIRFDYRPFFDSGGYPGTAIALSVGSAASYHGGIPSFQGAVTTSTDLAVWQMDGARPFHPCKPMVIEWRMSDVEEAQFFNTNSSPGVVGGIYAMVPSATAGRQYGTLFGTWLLEFKGRL
jgi:hypothetical protein